MKYIIRILVLPFFAGIVLFGVIGLYFKYLINFVRFGGEAIAYTDKNQRKTIKDIYNILEPMTKDIVMSEEWSKFY